MTSVVEAEPGSVGLRRGRFRTESTAGAAGRELRLLGRQYAAVSRTVVIACAGALALIASGPGNAVLVGVVAAINLWNVGYAIALRRVAGAWLLYVDLGVVAGVCLSQSWTVPTAFVLNGTGWVLVVVSIVIVACQWHTGTVVGIAVTVLLTSAYILGSVLADPAAWGGALSNVWLIAEGGLSRGLFVLLRRGAWAADRLIGQRERTRRAAVIAAARRADEREYLSALHDTAAATLLMVGIGVVDGRQPWLAEQAARDAAVLRGERDDDNDGDVDLAPLLADVAARSRLEVVLSLPPELVLPRAAGLALCGAVTEALTNAAHHSGRAAVSLVAGETAGRVCVEVTDEGRGFVPDAVPPGCYGVSSSIVERMHRAGGTATVTSWPGRGTRVRVEWPDG